MKTTLSIIGVLMLISSVVLAGGIENPTKPSSNVAIIKSNSGVKVIYKAEDACQVKISIYDNDNKEIFSEEVKAKASFMRPYNLDNMPEGDYRIVVKDADETSESIVNTSKSRESALIGLVRASDDRYLITLTSPVKTDIFLKLTDEFSNVIHTEKLAVDGNLSKLFNLKNVAGSVTAELTSEEGLSKTLQLK